MTMKTSTRPAGRWRRHVAIGAILFGVVALGVSAAMAQTTIRLAHVNPADWHISQ